MPALPKKKRMEIVKAKTQKVLKKMSEYKGCIRVGATKKPVRRARDYAGMGYRGTMYYARTTNMEYAENGLLKHAEARHNKHLKSNIPEGKKKNRAGYVYIIVGRKMNVGRKINVGRKRNVGRK